MTKKEFDPKSVTIYPEHGLTTINCWESVIVEVGVGQGCKHFSPATNTDKTRKDVLFENVENEQTGVITGKRCMVGLSCTNWCKSL